MILLEDLKVYQLAMETGEAVYDIVLKWDIFNKKNLGANLHVQQIPLP